MSAANRELTIDWRDLMSKKALAPSDVEAVREAFRMAMDREYGRHAPDSARELRANIGGEEAFFGTEDFVSTFFELIPDAQLPAPSESDARLLFLSSSLPLVACIQVVRNGRDVYLSISDDGESAPRLDIREGDETSRSRLMFWILDNPDLVEKAVTDVRSKAEVRNRNKSRIDKPRTVTVVDLRASHRGNAEAVREAKRTYRSRWIVRGHWHRFWTGKRDGERKLEPRYVMPYVKGPDGAPLNVTDKVSKW